MIPPTLPGDESARLAALRSLDILDTPPEERFDRLTRLARRLFNVPIALISLVDADRQWAKSCAGVGDGSRELPRDQSFCAHAILDDTILLLPDLGADPRFRDHPMVAGAPHLRFYGGCPITLSNGSRIGTLCLLDVRPRQFEAEDCALLRDLTRMAKQEIAALQLATMDELTQLSNRRGFNVLGEHALRLCVRLGRPASMLFFDLDAFKSINDRCGHAEGDRALADFGALLVENFRDSDVVGRLGGDEFVVLMTHGSVVDSAAALARLERAVDAHNSGGKRGYALRYSVGQVVHDRRQHAGMAELIAAADAAMYARKRLRRAA